MNRLKELRELHGERQQDIADFLNITQKAVSFYELGQRDIPNDALIKLAQHFNTSIDCILGRFTVEEQKLIDEAVRKIIDANTPPSERFAPDLLPGLDDPRRDVIEKIANMDEQSMKAVKGIVDVMCNKKTEAGSHDVQ